MTRISEIKERLAKATPGEWRPGRPDMLSYLADGSGKAFKYVYIGKSQEIAISTKRPVADSQLIGNAPSDLRYLLDRVKELEGAVEHLVFCATCAQDGPDCCEGGKKINLLREKESQ